MSQLFIDRADYGCQLGNVHTLMDQVNKHAKCTMMKSKRRYKVGIVGKQSNPQTLSCMCGISGVFFF